MARLKVKSKESSTTFTVSRSLMNKNTMIHLKFTLPPSVNHAFGGKDIRYKTASYRNWEELADSELRKQEQFTIEWDEWLRAQYIIHIDLYTLKGDKRIIDAANYEKCISDFLGWYVDPITRENKARRYKHLWVQRIPWFHDHKILENSQKKMQKTNGEEDWIEVIIEEVVWE